MIVCDRCGEKATNQNYTASVPSRLLATLDLCDDCKGKFEECLDRAIEDFKSKDSLDFQNKNKQSGKQPDKHPREVPHNTQQKVETRESAHMPEPVAVSPPRVPEPAPAPGRPNPADPKPHSPTSTSPPKGPPKK